MPIVIVSNSTMPHECSFLQGVLYFCPKKYRPLRPLLSINSGL